MLDKTLNETELAAWKSFNQVCLNFVGLHNPEDFEDVAATCYATTTKWDARCHSKFIFYIHI